jgi:hypothetical protein
MDEHELTTVEQLREVYPPPAQRALDKQQDHIDQHCRRFIGLSPFVLISTASATGECDVSPKGGPAGFVAVLDEHRLLVPDATGNRRLDSLQNLLQNPQVGMLFLIPGMGETLRINGTASVTRDPERLAGLQTGGRAPELALIVEVREAYLHCAKALLRSQLWDPESWSPHAALPSAAEILSDHTGLHDVEKSAAALVESYTTRI